jgi:hypothetical protein
MRPQGRPKGELAGGAKRLPAGPRGTARGAEGAT